MQLPHGAIVVIVDGKKLELFRNSGDEAHPVLDVQAPPRLDEHDRGAGAHHHASSANPTGHLSDEDAHAAAVAGWLQSQVVAQKIQHVVVIAAPRTLGEMRQHYGKQVQGALIGELSKDLAGRSGAEVLQALRAK